MQELLERLDKNIAIADEWAMSPGLDSTYRQMMRGIAIGLKRARDIVALQPHACRPDDHNRCVTCERQLGVDPK